MKTLIIIIIVLSYHLFACSPQKKATTQAIDIPKEMSLSAPQTTTCQLVEKEFINKGGKVTEYKELYLRCSIQDYFIKFCESNVTRKELEPYIDSGITVKMEIRQGMWDHCDPNPAYIQSRTGTYVAILSIEK